MTSAVSDYTVAEWPDGWVDTGTLTFFAALVTSDFAWAPDMDAAAINAQQTAGHMLTDGVISGRATDDEKALAADTNDNTVAAGGTADRVFLFVNHGGGPIPIAILDLDDPVTFLETDDLGIEWGAYVFDLNSGTPLFIAPTITGASGGGGGEPAGIEMPAVLGWNGVP